MMIASPSLRMMIGSSHCLGTIESHHGRSTNWSSCVLESAMTRARIIADSKTQLLQFVDLPWWLSIVPKQWLLPIIIRKLGEAIIISSVKRQRHLEGRAISEIAKERGLPLHEAMLDLLVEED